ncbi:MFS transporter [Planococcus halotolerans]|uniref:Major facilitator superfamily (MFS) profile domain-containing protein n=1 Tax=Planococcus halotolerans TaxID=2233542 RepID=A0A365KK82_9BACL|nr:MFS transporter [Planococcus halotolerans]RAZ73469.1 hypothetical protein DP120_17200 [Planococcus halotolerans]
MNSRSYYLYIGALAITFFGNGLHSIGLVWLIYNMNSSVTDIGWFFIFSMLPGILLAPIAGVISDLMSRQKLMIITDIFRALLIIVLLILFNLNLLNLFIIYIVTFLIGCFDKFFFPASSALLREIVEEKELFKANSFKNSAIQVGLIFGNALGGFLIAIVGMNAVIVINLLSYLLSAIFIKFITSNYFPLRKQKINFKLKESYSSFSTSLREGIAYLKNKPSILQFVTISASLELVVRSMNILLLPFLITILYLDSKAYGLIDTAFAIGSVMGGMTSSFFLKKIGKSNFLPLNLFVIGISFITFSFSNNFIIPFFIYFLIGFNLVQVQSFVTSEIQKQVKIEFQGRTHSSIHFILSIMAVIITPFISWLADSLSLRLVFLLIGILVISSAIWSIYLIKSKLILVSTKSN